MNTYLIFFGKSQDFTAEYYDRNQPIENFNSIIRDFDLLESNYFTIDDINNGEILSRYNFINNGRNYTLLKLYSFAQAFDGSRIAGSIYGVGLLSDSIIGITKQNLLLLKTVKENFAKLSLDGLRFNKTDFKSDSDRIWKGIVEYSNGNLFDTIEYLEVKNFIEKPLSAIHVNNLLEDSIKLNRITLQFEKTYFSNDIEHLKRTQLKWGAMHFPIYQLNNNEIKIFELNKDIKNTSSLASNLKSDLNIDNSTLLRKDLKELENQNKKLHDIIYKMTKKNKLLFFLNLLFLFISFVLSFFLYFNFFDVSNELKTEKSQIKQISSNSIITPDFFYSKSGFDSGIVFFESVSFIKSFDVKKQKNDSLKLYNSFQIVNRMAIRNNINVDFIKQLYSNKNEQLKVEKVSIKKIKKDSIARNVK